MASFRPRTLSRQVPVVPSEAALLFIDVQNYNCSKEGALFKDRSPEELKEGIYGYFFNKIDAIKSNLVRLQRTCREAGVEVMYTVIQSLTRDGRDMSMDYKISGFHVPKDCWDAQVIDCIRPGPDRDEIIIPKTSSSVFQSTNIEYVLRSMGMKYLILCGCLTDQCVDHAVRDACDLGFYVTLVTDGCATFSEDRQESALAANRGYCRQLTTDELVQELRK